MFIWAEGRWAIKNAGDSTVGYDVSNGHHTLFEPNLITTRLLFHPKMNWGWQVLSQSGRLLSGGRGRKGLLFVTSRGSASVVSDSPSVEGGGPSSAFEPTETLPSPRNR